MYIAFEGHDGSGKSLTADVLTSKLIELGKSVYFLRAPGTTKYGQYIRGNWHDNHRVRFLQLLANHVELIEDKIKPALAAGKWVVQDRTFISSLVYQGFAGPLNYEDIFRTSRLWIDTLPNKLFFLECTPEIAAARLEKIPKDLPDPDEDMLRTLRLAYTIESRVWGGETLDTSVLTVGEIVKKCLTSLGL